MCGICGWVGPDAGPAELPAGRAMRDLLEHRGPDGAGEHEFASAAGGTALRGWFGHRRLRIVDVSDAAHQPMLSDDGRVALTYNGEIYNFRELRAELAAAGHAFRSTGDTEVVLRAYEAWGERFVERLDGMFALAVWDGRVGRLLLARDRTGKKPLYYSQSGGRLTFGSEIKALRAAPWLRAGPELARLPELLAFGYVPWPHTLYEGIRQVPPACVVVHDAGGTRPPEPYWDPVAPRLDDPPAGVLDARIREKLRAAVARRLVADVPLGAFLSGGIDSSIVVGLMSELIDEPVSTFAIGFPDEPSFDERAPARRVARHFGTRHTEFAVHADAVALLDHLLWHHDQPFADSSAIPTYLVSQLAREHVTVVLTGDGGDEVFGGYERFTAARIGRWVPPPVARMAERAARRLPRDAGYYSVRRRAERFLAVAELPLPERYRAWVSVFDDAALAAVMPGRDAGKSLASAYAEAARLPALDRILHANLRTYLPDDLHVKIDRMTMAHSLEARSPFLDTALIECLARVPASRKVGVRRVKPLLRRALRPLLPDAIWDRRKHGFGVPMGRWMRGELGTMFEDEVLAADARSRELLAPDGVRRLWEAHRRGEADHGQQLWTLLTVERWLRTAERPPAPQPPQVAVAA